MQFNSGDLEGGRTFLLEVLRLYDAAGSHRHAAAAKPTLAEIEFIAGHAEEALQLAEESVDFFSAHQDMMRASCSLNIMAGYLSALKRYREAMIHARKALRWARTVGNRIHYLLAMQHLAAAIPMMNSHSDRSNEAGQCAAKILGFVDESLTRHHFTRDFVVAQDYQIALVALRGMFEEQELQTLMATGKEWSEEQAAAAALAI